jgi:hypothetical protein
MHRCSCRIHLDVFNFIFILYNEISMCCSSVMDPVRSMWGHRSITSHVLGWIEHVRHELSSSIAACTACLLLVRTQAGCCKKVSVLRGREKHSIYLRTVTSQRLKKHKTGQASSLNVRRLTVPSSLTFAQTVAPVSGVKRDRFA